MKKKLLAPLSFGLGVVATVVFVLLIAAAPPATEKPGTAKPLFPTNSRGETYGSVMGLTSLDDYPDLIAAENEDGLEGYIRQSEADAFEPKNPEEALKWQEEYMAQGGFHYVNLYDKEGAAIGKFRMGSSEDFDSSLINTPEHDFLFPTD